MHKPKTLEDFPQFRVAAVRRGRSSADGHTTFELEGKFDRVIEGSGPRWFWLLFGERDCLCATVKSFDKESQAAVLTCELDDEPRVVGQSLAYLSPDPNPSITTGQPNTGARRWRLRPNRFHPEGAAGRGEAAPRPYLLVACPHVIDGSGS